MESLIDNQQVDLQIGFRPGTQPSNNEQMKVERDNRLRSRVLKDEEANNDDDEERYCFCNQISFGEMVGCDNEQCPYEWFHLACIGLSEAPQGEFICSFCKQQQQQ